jgi:MFS transporter, PHS family, inorganic phosphate transporter
MDVERDGKQAVLDIRRHRDLSNDQRATSRQDAIDEITRIGPDGNPARGEIEKLNYFTWLEVKNFLFTEGNWRYLAATSLCWFLLDFAFYGLGINNPRQLAAIWASTPFNFTALHDWRNMTTPSFCQLPNSQQIALTLNHTYDWQNPFDPDSDMYWELFSNAKQYIITISCGSMGGSIVLLLLGDRISRRKWLMYSFLILAASFATTAIVLQHVELTDRHSATIVFYVICQFFFNFGVF